MGKRVDNRLVWIVHQGRIISLESTAGLLEHSDLPEVRSSATALLAAASLVTGGVLLNRLNVAVISMRVKHWETYFPSVGEVMTTLAVVAAGVLAFGWALRNLPLHSEPPMEEVEASQEPGRAVALC